MYATELFSEDHGDVVVFLPIGKATRPKLVGRVEPIEAPAAELAVVTHAGSYDAIAVAYGELGAYVAAHELAVDGPLREYYVRDPYDHRDPAEWLTEIAWRPYFDRDERLT